MVGIENTLDELAPELKKMRVSFYTEKAKSVLPGKLTDILCKRDHTDVQQERYAEACGRLCPETDYPNIEVIVTDNALTMVRKKWSEAGMGMKKADLP